MADEGTCGVSKIDYTSIIKSDFAICTQPENSIKGALCVDAALNEGYNCGFRYEMLYVYIRDPANDLK